MIDAIFERATIAEYSYKCSRHTILHCCLSKIWFCDLQAYSTGKLLLLFLERFASIFGCHLFGGFIVPLFFEGKHWKRILSKPIYIWLMQNHKKVNNNLAFSLLYKEPKFYRKVLTVCIPQRVSQPRGSI